MIKAVLTCVFCLVCYFDLIVSEHTACPHIVNRKDWGAREPDSVEYIAFPLDYAIIHHTATEPCNNRDECSQMLRSIQNFHMNPDNDFGDIGYSFMVGGDGNVYEGRGWHKQGAHLYGYNSRSIGIAFIGDFTNISPTPEQIKAGKSLLACGVKLGELSKNYKLHGAKQVSATESPGARLYNKMKNWPHYAEPEK